MDPNEVRFTQSSIRYTFKDGRTIDELADDLKSGKVQVEDIPPLRLFIKDGIYFSLDNRRLEAFRRAGVRMPFRMASPEEIEDESWKVTTKNEGVSIRVRGEGK